MKLVEIQPEIIPFRPKVGVLDVVKGLPKATFGSGEDERPKFQMTEIPPEIIGAY